MVTQPSRRTALALFVAALALIGVMTLVPSSTPEETPTFCVFCGSLGGVDFTLNVILFAPLGLAARWVTGRWITAVAIAAAVTFSVEALQWQFIPGRDASLGDLIANTLGAMVGAWLAVQVRSVLHAPPARARTVAAALGIATSFIIALSATLLRPHEPIGAQYVQWTPPRPNMDLFRGQLVAVQLNGRLLRPREAFPSQWTYDSTRAMALRAVIRTPVPPSRRQAIIVRIANEQFEGFMLAQRGEAVVFRSTMGATRLKLRPILIALKHGLAAPPDTGRVLILHGSSDARAISLAREQRSGASIVTLRRTVGLAWALLLPWDLALDARWWPVNTIWLATLLFPVTFLTARLRHERPRSNGNPIVDIWPLGLSLVTLVAVPAMMGLSVLVAGDWLGVVIGVASGVLVERPLRRRLSTSVGFETGPTTQS